MDDLFMDEDSLSDWSGPITPPAVAVVDMGIDNIGDEIQESQCVVPLSLRKVDQSRKQPSNRDPQRDKVAFLNCYVQSGIVNSAEGYLESGLLQRLLDNKEPYPGYFREKSVELLGIRFHFREGLLQPNRRKLFLLLRQCHHRLMQDRCYSTENSEFDFLRRIKECNILFAYIQQYLFSSSKLTEYSIPKIKDHNSVVSSILQEIKTLLSSVGTLKYSMAPLDRNIKVLDKNNIHQFLCHLALDVNWAYIVILSQLCLQDSVDATTRSEYLTLLDDRCSALMLYLINEARKNANENTRYAWDQETCYFPCPCCKELWILLIHLLDGLAARISCQAFWSLYSSVTSAQHTQLAQKSAVQENNYQEAQSFRPRNDHISFSWWMLWGIAPLYWYDATGKRNFKQGIFLPANWLHVQDLLRATLKSKDCVLDEKIARESIKCCLKLAKIWDSSSDVIAFLWDFFHKRLNEKFTLEVHGIFNTAVPCLSSLQWMEKYSKLSSQDFLDREDYRTTSFELFLQLLALGLRRTKRGTQSYVWGQMKGRLYSKFHKKRMEDLNDIGVKNFISLFMVLALCVDTEDVASKMCSFLNLIHRNKRTLSMSQNLIKGMFAMLHAQRKMKAEAPFLTEKLVSEFKESCREFADRHKDSMVRRNNWQLINLYFDSTEEAYDSEYGLECEATLIQVGDSLSAIISNCSDSEARRAFTFVYAVLSSPRLQTSSNANFQTNARVVWSGLYNWIAKLLVDRQLLQQIPESLADVAAGFTILSANSLEPDVKKADFKDMLVKFCAVEIPARFIVKYLCHLLNSSSAVNKIIDDKQQPLIVNSWLKCLLSLSESNPHVIELTRLVSNLPEVYSLVGKQNTTTTQQIQQLAFSFIVALGNKFISTHQIQEIIQLRSQANAYFGNILKFTESFLQTGAPVDSLRLAFSLIGKLLKHCSKIIYSKTSPDCLLPKILDQMILPLQSIKKMTPAAVTNCLVGHIHQFLAGLSTLDFKRDEYVRRKIKEIFNRYFLVTTKRCNASPGSKNPFLVALQNTFLSQPPESASDFRQFVVEILAENFLVLPQPPDNHSAALYFVLQLFQKTQCDSEIVKNSPAVIMQIMCSIISCDACRGTSSEPPGIRKPATEILTLITKANKNASSDSRTKLQHQLQNVLMLNVPQFQGIVFKSFELLAKLDSKLASSLVETARESVEECERARGCGEDKYLRRILDGFISGIG